MGRWLAICLWSLLCLGCPSQSLKGSNVSSFDELLEHYYGYEPVRALAVAMDAEDDWAYGVIEAELTEKRATKRALKACEKTREARGIAAECRIYALGEKVVWEGPKPE